MGKQLSHITQHKKHDSFRNVSKTNFQIQTETFLFLFASAEHFKGTSSLFLKDIFILSKVNVDIEHGLGFK